jgi:hypothetical protein
MATIAESTYLIEIDDQVLASSPEEALGNTLLRFAEEETVARVTNLNTGEVVYMECTTISQLSTTPH